MGGQRPEWFTLYQDVGPTIVFIRSLPAEASEHERKSALTWMRAVHRDLKNQDTSWPFVEPVNRDTTPLYYEIIRNPIDLKMIGQKIREKVRVWLLSSEGSSTRATGLDRILTPARLLNPHTGVPVQGGFH